MELIIDASNIKAGGGLTHLQEIMNTDAAQQAGFNRVFLWAPDATLASIADRPWLEKCHHPLLNAGYRQVWQWKRGVFEPFARSRNALVYIPGTGGSKSRYVTMCQNLLPLQTKELNRYFFSKDWIRLRLLRSLHKNAYSHAAGVVFLNRYCREYASKLVGRDLADSAIIPHGLSSRFLVNDKLIYTGSFTEERPFRLVYVSIIDVYKHQWVVAEAVYQLVSEGFNIQLDLIGPAYPKALNRLNRVMQKYASVKNAVHYRGPMPYQTVNAAYAEGDAFVFASSCETFGMVLTEAMAAGLPVMCSSMSSMPETAGDAALYFDPLSVTDTKAAIVKLYEQPMLREALSKKSLAKARSMSWDHCARQTFSFLAQVSQSCAE
ncbi:MAG TPA: glycosyltransferase family 1 protein [Phnomibacter sp.]|nr:glycosyltransferase family 1 protein [Phnomibacter sp.]